MSETPLEGDMPPDDLGRDLSQDHDADTDSSDSSDDSSDSSDSSDDSDDAGAQ